MSDGVAVCVLNIHVDARKNKTIDRLSQETRDIPPPSPPSSPLITWNIIHFTSQPQLASPLQILV